MTRIVPLLTLALALTAGLPGAIFGQQTPLRNGIVSFATTPPNQIVSLRTKLDVPALPAGAAGTLFLWPGLQPIPGGAHYMPINNGVLQSVLTWGPSCAPGNKPANPHSTWWISSQYVNSFGHYSGYTGCLGGPIMSVNVGDTLAIDFSLFKSVWTETVLDLQNRQNVSFHISLADQAQAVAHFEIEPAGASPRGDVTFLETTISFAFPDVHNCDLGTHGPDDSVSPPIILDDGQSCYIEKIVLSSKKGP